MFEPQNDLPTPMTRILFATLLALTLNSCAHSSSETPRPFSVHFRQPSAILTNLAVAAEDCTINSPEAAAYEYHLDLNLWDRVREGFKLSETINKRTQAELNWYARHPSHIDRVSIRAQRYLYYIVEQLEKRNMPLEFALMPIVESAFDPFAYSHGRAAGMWQVIPGTGKMLGLKQNWWYDGRRDIVASTDAALNYLEQLHARFDDDWLLALAAYNGGGGNVSKAIRRNKAKGKPTDYWSLDLPRETEAYVPKLLALKAMVANPEHYGIAIPHLPNTATFAVIDVGSQLDLAQAADMAGISMREFYMYNPGFNRWATDPDGPHELLIPMESSERFIEALSKLPNSERVSWERYTIRNGDSLSTIASRYNTSTELLQSINNLSSTRIRAGKVLLVPRASADSQHYVLSAAQRLMAKQNSGQGRKVQYAVQQGDSLWSIGKKLNLSYKQLAKWNGLAPKDTIRPGQTLVYWRKDGTRSEVNTTRKLAYTVRRGDSLARIADKFDIRIADILSWNSVNPKKYLQPGDSLTLFVDVTDIQ